MQMLEVRSYELEVIPNPISVFPLSFPRRREPALPARQVQCLDLDPRLREGDNS